MYSRNYFGDSVIRTVFFSDSILLISSDDSADSATQLIYHVANMLRNALIAGIPLKGAIAHGEQTADFDKSLHFGQPLIDAHKLQDELYLYGVVLHHSAEQHIKDNGCEGPRKLLPLQVSNATKKSWYSQSLSRGLLRRPSTER